MTPKSSIQSGEDSDIPPAQLRRTSSRNSSKPISIEPQVDNDHGVDDDDDILSSAESGEILSISSSDEGIIDTDLHTDADDDKQTEVIHHEDTEDPDDDREDGEVDPNAERKEIESQISRDLSKAEPDVLQKNARYFMLTNVVCSKCGIKGHLSYDCPEEDIEERCFLCGGVGHSSKNCPSEVCYICGENGHRAKECTSSRKKVKTTVKRDVPPSREPRLRCYVCGEEGHLDCGLKNITQGKLSCFNCGDLGHTGHGCRLPSADRTLPTAMEMEKTRVKRKREQKGKASKKKQKRKSFDEKDESKHSGSDNDDDNSISGGVELRNLLLMKARSGRMSNSRRMR